jgi:hypothetical protein
VVAIRIFTTLLHTSIGTDLLERTDFAAGRARSTPINDLFFSHWCVSPTTLVSL